MREWFLFTENIYACQHFLAAESDCDEENSPNMSEKLRRYLECCAPGIKKYFDIIFMAKTFDM
jgi:hypothetical protein